MKKSRQQSGFSLIELLVASSFGLVFGSIAIGSLVNSRTSYEYRMTGALVEDNARMAIEEMTTMIRMAGYVNTLSPGADVPMSTFYTGPCGTFDRCTKDGTDTGSDQIAFMLNPPPDDGSETDCVGGALHDDSAVAARSVVAHLFLVTENDGVSALSCQTFIIKSDGTAIPVNDSPQELVQGVSNMQILYGKSNMQDSREQDTQLSYYASADTVNATAPPEGSTTPWIDLVAVRIALLVNSGQDDYSQDLETRKFKLLDGPEIERTDRKVWQLFSATVMMNNSEL